MQFILTDSIESSILCKKFSVRADSYYFKNHITSQWLKWEAPAWKKMKYALIYDFKDYIHYNNNFFNTSDYKLYDNAYFHWACEGGNIEMINKLRINYINNDLQYHSDTIKIVCNKGHLTVLKNFIENFNLCPMIGENMQNMSILNECFNSACIGGHQEVIQYLFPYFEKAGDGNHTKDYARKFQFNALKSGNLKVLKELRNLHGNISVAKRSFIELCSRSGSKNIIEYLVAEGYFFNGAYSVAVSRGNHDIAELFDDEKIKIEKQFWAMCEAQNKFEGSVVYKNADALVYNAIIAACYGDRFHILEYILFNFPSSPDSIKNGLSIAVKNGNLKTIKVLLAWYDKLHNTPVHRIAELPRMFLESCKGDFEIFKLFYCLGFNFSTSYILEGIILAIEADNVEVVAFILAEILEHSKTETEIETIIILMEKIYVEAQNKHALAVATYIAEKLYSANNSWQPSRRPVQYIPFKYNIINQWIKLKFKY